MWDGIQHLDLASAERHFASDRGGGECFRIARKFILRTPHILGFGVENMAENGQKLKDIASDKLIF